MASPRGPGTTTVPCVTSKRCASAAPIAGHRVRDFEAFRPWEPSRSAEFFTP